MTRSVSANGAATVLGQAKSRLKSNGYNDLSGPEKNDSGICDGQAEKKGLPVSSNCSARTNLSSEGQRS